MRYFSQLVITCFLSVILNSHPLCHASTLDDSQDKKFKIGISDKVQFLIQDQLTEEMDQLRLQCFPPPSPQLTSQDEFDERSKHLIVMINTQIAAYLRMTPGPNSVIEGWTNGQAQILMGKGVIDFSRVCVSPLFRGTLLYEAIILKGFQYATNHEYHSVVGCYEPNRHIGIRVKKLGFKDNGNPLYTNEPDGSKFFIQPVIFETKLHHYDWERLIQFALYSSPEKFWKNLIHLDIQTLEREDFINNHALLQEIKEITAPSYEDPTALIIRDLGHCNKLYLGRESDGKLVTFFMVGWELLCLKSKSIQSVFLGLSATREDQKDSGIVRHLYRRFMTDAQAWEEHHKQKLLLWYTTATPSSFYATNLIFSENQPHVDGTYTEDGKACALMIRAHMKWPEFTTGHPFVVKGIAEKTRYSASERERIKKIEESKNFTLFTELGIDETQGDRMVRICRVPSRNLSAKL